MKLYETYEVNYRLHGSTAVHRLCMLGRTAEDPEIRLTEKYGDRLIKVDARLLPPLKTAKRRKEDQ